MNIGYFTSFTAFLALNDADFCNNYLRDAPYKEGILPLAGYLQFWGCFFVVVTLLIAVFKHETNFQPAGGLHLHSNAQAVFDPSSFSSRCRYCMQGRVFLVINISDCSYSSMTLLTKLLLHVMLLSMTASQGCITNKGLNLFLVATSALACLHMY